MSTVQTAEAACPACGEVVYPGEDFCEACGHRLGDSPPAPPPAAGPPARACAHCGEPAVDDEGYCGHCGLKQPAERDHLEIELPGQAAVGVSDRGRRYPRNEDYLALAACSPHLIGVVCDGVGSSPHPDAASRAAAEAGAAALRDRLAAGDDPAAATRAAALHAARAVAALAPSPADAPSCTYVSAVASPGQVTVGWVGDSRVYWVAASEPPPRDPEDTEDTSALTGSRQLTDDDSWAALMVARGALSEAEAEAHPNAHVITAWLGADADEVEPHVRTFSVDRPGTVVVCSDGLWNYLPDAAALRAAAGSPATPLDAARALVGHALEAGGRDNITVTLLPVTATNGVRP
ncbi:protein phosphatase 2C domain-containing protein [Actinomadura flavalba]|uniref:protein phosphatase 2C domain-containing protein n=1 Tax=Actinomadura flavalba TaxID=1120938 RepID=UPI00036C6772|nr:protein phosphatase 2C domain-containing protein [Actinomadura flavalba]